MFLMYLLEIESEVKLYDINCAYLEAQHLRYILQLKQSNHGIHYLTLEVNTHTCIQKVSKLLIGDNALPFAVNDSDSIALGSWLCTPIAKRA